MLFAVVPTLYAVAIVVRRAAILMAIDNLIAVSVLLFWVLRNVPCWPFVMLSPC